MAREPFLINPAGLGESLVVLGVGNPRRRPRRQRRRQTMARRRMPAALARYWATHRRGGRRRARARTRHNSPRYRARRHNAPRYRRARRMHDNVRYVTRYRRRGYRHNRAVRRRVGLGGGIALGRPASWMPPVLAAGAGATTATVLPRIIVGAGATTPVVYLIQVGTGVVGAGILAWTRMVRPVTAFSFFLGATVPVVSDLFARFVMPWLGMAAYSYETAAELAEMGQEPHYPPTLSAYSYEAMNGLAEVGDDDLGVSPGYNIDSLGDAVGAAGYGSAAPEAPWARAAMVGH